jgi:copper resistance protein C
VCRKDVMNRARAVRVLVARLALGGIAAVVLAFVAPGAALALEVHHIYPLPGSTSATAPNHLEVMFDHELQPGRVQMGISPDTTDVPIALAPLLVDGNIAVQPLPALAGGAYTAGFRVLARDGHLYQGTFHFTVGGGATAPAAPAVASPRSDPAPARSWLVGGVAVGLTLPALATVVARMWRRRRSRTLAGTVTPSVDPSHRP